MSGERAVGALCCLARRAHARDADGRDGKRHLHHVCGVACGRLRAVCRDTHFFGERACGASAVAEGAARTSMPSESSEPASERMSMAKRCCRCACTRLAAWLRMVVRGDGRLRELKRGLVGVDLARGTPEFGCIFEEAAEDVAASVASSAAFVAGPVVNAHMAPHARRRTSATFHVCDGGRT